MFGAMHGELWAGYDPAAAGENFTGIVVVERIFERQQINYIHVLDVEVFDAAEGLHVRRQLEFKTRSEADDVRPGQLLNNIGQFRHE